MTRGWVQGSLRVGLNIAALAAAGFGAEALHDRLPHGMHGALFAAVAAIAGILVLFSTQVFSKLDKILEATEQYEVVQTEKAYTYVGELRRRLVFWVVAAAVGLVAAVGASTLIRERAFRDDFGVVLLGYVSLAVVALASIRVVTGYLSLDEFRLDLLKRMKSEKARVDALRALKPSEVLPDIATAKPMVVRQPRARV